MARRRKKLPVKSIVAFARVDPDTYNSLVRLAERERRPTSQKIRNILEEYVEYVARQSRRAARREPPAAEIGAQA